MERRVIEPSFEKRPFSKDEVFFKNKLLKFSDNIIELKPCLSVDRPDDQDWEYLDDDKISEVEYNEGNDLLEITMESGRIYILLYASYPDKMMIRRAE